MHPGSLIHACTLFHPGVLVHGHWRPGIGDPTPAGWITTAAYFVASLLCAWAAVRASRMAVLREAQQHAYFWLILGFVLFALGINKQLDLQTWLWLAGRKAAHAQGWYAYRRSVQVFFISLVAGSGVAGIGLFIWLCRGALRRYAPALLGAVFVAAFVIVRAASFHHIDEILGREWAGLKANLLLELPGIVLVTITAAAVLFRSRRGRSVPAVSPPPQSRRPDQRAGTPR